MALGGTIAMMGPVTAPRLCPGHSSTPALPRLTPSTPRFVFLGVALWGPQRCPGCALCSLTHCQLVVNSLWGRCEGCCDASRDDFSLFTAACSHGD